MRRLTIHIADFEPRLLGHEADDTIDTRDAVVVMTQLIGIILGGIRDRDLAEDVGASVARAIGDVLDHVHTTHDRKERPDT